MHKLAKVNRGPCFRTDESSEVDIKVNPTVVSLNGEIDSLSVTVNVSYDFTLNSLVSSLERNLY